MRKAYMKPALEIECYDLSQAIAANCGRIVTLGPGDSVGTVCDEFGGSFEVRSLNPGYDLMSSGTSFYDGTTGPVCDCYYSSGGQGYFTS